MVRTDNPLKQLVTAFIGDFAAWLLGVEVVEATPRATEFPPGADPLKPDQVFHVRLTDGRTVILHIEFQGRRSHKPMSLRFLDYQARLADAYRGHELQSVVFYVGQGAGQHDTGSHHIHQPDGQSALAWRYQVIRLWQLDAAAVLALGRPALLALVGQMQMAQPQVVLAQVIETFRAVPDAEQQHRLLTALVALINNEELLTMIETLLDDDDLLLDTPFMRRVQAKYEEGREDGRMEGVRRDILKTLQIRFSLTAEQVGACAGPLEQVPDEARLDRLFEAALQAESLVAFQAILAQPPAPDAA